MNADETLRAAATKLLGHAPTSAELSEFLTRIEGRWFGDKRVVCVGVEADGTKRWRVEKAGE